MPPTPNPSKKTLAPTHYPTESPTESTTDSPTDSPTKPPALSPTLPPTLGDTAIVSVGLSLTGAAGAPSSGDKASLKTQVAAATGLAESDLRNFAVTSAVSRRRLLATYTWTVTFEAVASLTAVGGADVSALSASIAADLTAPAFASAVATALSVTVDASSVSAAVATRAVPAPTPMPVATAPAAMDTSAPEKKEGDDSGAAAAANMAIIGVLALLVLGIVGVLAANHGAAGERAPEAETRMDGDEGPFTREAFYEVYGGYIEWNAAGVDILNGDVIFNGDVTSDDNKADHGTSSREVELKAFMSAGAPPNPLSSSMASSELAAEREQRLGAADLSSLSWQDLGGLEADLQAKVVGLNGALGRVASECAGRERLAERALEREREEKTCVVCMNAFKTTLLLPCRHLCLCSTCALRPDIKECPICRTYIAGTMEVIS
jgi:hypothetical protein